MIRKTKKGPRRLREMPVRASGVFVATSYTGCEYITAGTVYRKDDSLGWTFGITDDVGDGICVGYPGGYCGHLNGVGVWEYVRVMR